MYGILMSARMCACLHACVPHLQLKLKLWHDGHKQQWVDGKQLLYEVKDMLRQITHRGLTHHQHLIKELRDTTAQGKQHIRKQDFLQIRK